MIMVATTATRDEGSSSSTKQALLQHSLVACGESHLKGYRREVLSEADGHSPQQHISRGNSGC